jgi:tetratricopeptide (TPR) repeat protein
MRFRHWGMAIVVALAFASPAAAQYVDPTSSQNVAPNAAPRSLAGLESQRKALFAAMLRDPANLDVAFEYAAVSAQLGDLEGAISTLERMLIYSPGLPRLQFELGVLYYRLGAYQTSETYLRTVAANPAVPAEVQGQVATYLDAIAAGGQGKTVTAMLTAGIRWQSNANAGPSDPAIILYGLPFQLNAGALGTADVNGYGTASLNSSTDLRRQGATLDISLAAYGAMYRNQTAFNTGVVEMKVGPTFTLQRFEMNNASLGFYGVASAAILGGSLYQGVLGAGTKLRVALNAKSRVILSLEGREELYLNSFMRPGASIGSGERYIASATWERQLTPAIMAFLTLTGERRVAGVPHLSHWKAAASTGIAIKFDSLIKAIEGKWTLAFSGGVRHQKNDAPDLMFSSDPKVTIQGFVEAKLTVPLGDNFALQGAASYTISTSNHALETFDNTTASVGLSKGF